MTMGHAQSEWRRELRDLIVLAVPVVLSELGWMAQGVVDNIMVGRLGPEAIGAVSLGNAVYYTPSLFGIGLLLSLDTLVSQAYGRRDHDECHRWLAQGVYLACFITPFLMLLIAAMSYNFARFGVTSSIATPASTYLRILNWSTLPLLLYGGIRRYLQGVGQVRVITATYVLANLLNWGGNWVLIYGKLGFPALGVDGSAISTCIARFGMAAALLLFAWRYERKRGHPLFRHWAAPQMERLRKLVRLGAPAAGQILLEVGAWNLSTFSASYLDPVALATHAIALNYASISYMVPLGRFGSGRSQRGPRRRSRQPGSRAPRRMACPGSGHQLHAGCRSGVSDSAPGTHLALHERPARAGRRSLIALDCCSLSGLRWHSDRLYRRVAWPRRNSGPHDREFHWLLDHGIAPGAHALFHPSLGNLRHLDWAHARPRSHRIVSPYPVAPTIPIELP